MKLDSHVDMHVSYRRLSSGGSPADAAVAAVVTPASPSPPASPAGAAATPLAAAAATVVLVRRLVMVLISMYRGAQVALHEAPMSKEELETMQVVVLAAIEQLTRQSSWKVG